MAFLTSGLLDFLSKIMEKSEGGTYNRSTDSNEAIAEAIAGLSLNVRSEFEIVTGNTTLASLQNLVNLTGSGKLYWVQGQGNVSPSICECRIVIDSVDIGQWDLAVDEVPKWFVWALDPDGTTAGSHPASSSAAVEPAALVNIDYQDSLLIQYSSSSGAASVYLKAAYSVD